MVAFLDLSTVKEATQSFSIECSRHKSTIKLTKLLIVYVCLLICLVLYVHGNSKYVYFKHNLVDELICVFWYLNIN